MIEIKSSASLQEALLFLTCPEGREGSEGACSRGAAGIGAGIGMRLAAQWLVAGGLVGIPEGACRYAAEGPAATRQRGIWPLKRWGRRPWWASLK